MAMLVGDPTCSTPLSATKAVWDALSVPGGPGAQLATESAGDYLIRSTQMKALVYGIVNGLITHIKTFAQTSAVVAGTSPSGPVTGTATGSPGTAIT